MKFIKRGKVANASKHNIGKSPNQTLLNKAKDNLLHQAVYNRNRSLLNYSGTPDRAFLSSTPYQVNGDYDCNFYIIWPTRGSTGDKIRIGFNLTTWDNYDVQSNCAFAWDGNPSQKTQKIATPNAIQTQVQSLSLTDIKKPNGLTVSDDYELDFDHQDFGGYCFTRVSFEHLQPASVVSWIMPVYEYDYVATDSIANKNAFYLSDSNFNIGQPVRGSNGYNDTNGSVGGLCQRQFNDGSTDSNMINNSDLCLFQWGHPAGKLISGGGGSLNYQNALGYDMQIKGRELKTANTGLFDVALIYRADAGTVLRIHVGSSGINYDYALTTATGATPAKEVFPGIPFNGSGDDITVSFNVSDTLAVEVKTLALFEKGD